jgi:hypothetical protein
VKLKLPKEISFIDYVIAVLGKRLGMKEILFILGIGATAAAVVVLLTYGVLRLQGTFRKTKAELNMTDFARSNFIAAFLGFTAYAWVTLIVSPFLEPLCLAIEDNLLVLVNGQPLLGAILVYGVLCSTIICPVSFFFGRFTPTHFLCWSISVGFPTLMGTIFLALESRSFLIPLFFMALFVTISCTPFWFGRRNTATVG